MVFASVLTLLTLWLLLYSLVRDKPLRFSKPLLGPEIPQITLWLMVMQIRELNHDWNMNSMAVSVPTPLDLLLLLYSLLSGASRCFNKLSSNTRDLRRIMRQTSSRSAPLIGEQLLSYQFCCANCASCADKSRVCRKCVSSLCCCSCSVSPPHLYHLDEIFDLTTTVSPEAVTSSILSFPIYINFPGAGHSTKLLHFLYTNPPTSSSTQSTKCVSSTQKPDSWKSSSSKRRFHPTPSCPTHGASPQMKSSFKTWMIRTSKRNRDIRRLSIAASRHWRMVLSGFGLIRKFSNLE